MSNAFRVLSQFDKQTENRMKERMSHEETEIWIIVTCVLLTSSKLFHRNIMRTIFLVRKTFRIIDTTVFIFINTYCLRRFYLESHTKQKCSQQKCKSSNLKCIIHQNALIAPRSKQNLEDIFYWFILRQLQIKEVYN